MKSAISARQLKTRLARVHKASGSAESLYAWFAGLAHVHPHTVYRWVKGERTFRGAALSLLEQMETQLSSNGKGKA